MTGQAIQASQQKQEGAMKFAIFNSHVETSLCVAGRACNQFHRAQMFVPGKNCNYIHPSEDGKVNIERIRKKEEAPFSTEDNIMNA